MNIENTKSYLENIKSTLISLKTHDYVWYKIDANLKICPEFNLIEPLKDDDEVVDFSDYFTEKDNSINKKLLTFYSIYNHLKRCNPNLSEQDIQIFFRNHLEQINNEKRRIV